jgi:hypothetical protein
MKPDALVGVAQENMSRPLGFQDFLLIGGIFGVVFACLSVIAWSVWAERKRERKRRFRKAVRSRKDFLSPEPELQRHQK